MPEAVDHPVHYQGKIECIEAIAIVLNQNALVQNPLYPPITSAILFNVIKYRWRENQKNGQEDLAKADWYRQWLVDHLSVRCRPKEVEALMSEFDTLVDNALAMKD